MHTYSSPTGDDAAWCARVAVALDEGRIALALQPVVDARDGGRIAFCEGLVRLMQHDGPPIPAGAFVGAVETTLVGRALDRAVLVLALDALADRPDLRLSVNLSHLGVGDPGWTDILRGRLAADPTLGERLIVEITETAVTRDADALARFIRCWQRAGVAFALDDFGAGYTAFRHLREIRFDILKIDGQFTRHVHRDADNQALMRALVGLGTHFEALVVAEAVETEDEAAFLARAGLDALQGYHIGRPQLMGTPARRSA